MDQHKLILCNEENYTNIVGTYSGSLSSSSIISNYYMFPGPTYLGGVELTFGPGGLGIGFGGPTMIEGGFSTNNLDEFIERPPAPPLDMSGISGPVDSSMWGTLQAMASDGARGLQAGGKAVINGTVKAGVGIPIRPFGICRASGSKPTETKTRKKSWKMRSKPIGTKSGINDISV